MSEFITIDEYERRKRDQGPSFATTPPETISVETAERIDQVTMADRQSLEDGKVRHKNPALFLGRKMMSDTYYEIRGREGISPPTRMDSIGEKIYSVGQLWYEKTHSAERDREQEDAIELPETVLGNMGFEVTGEITDETLKMAELLGIEDETEQQGLNRLLGHEYNELLSNLKDMVFDEVPLSHLDEKTQAFEGLYGLTNYDEATGHDLLVQQAVATAMGIFISGQAGNNVAMRGHEKITNLVQRMSGLDREEALTIADNLVGEAVEQISDNAAEIGEFDGESLERARRTSDPRGIVEKDLHYVPEEVYQSGTTYWAARTAAYAERAALARAGAPVELEFLKREMLRGVDNPVVRQAIDGVLAGIPMIDLQTGLSHTDLHTLETLRELTNPYTSPLANLTPGVEQTRAWRSMEARKKGLGQYVLNESVEVGFDFLAFLTEIKLTKGVLAKTKLMKWLTGKPALSPSMQRLAANAKPGGPIMLRADEMVRAATVSKYLRNAAFIGCHRALSTHGTAYERALSGAITGIYMSTPIATGKILHKLGHTQAGVLASILTDFSLNSALSTAITNIPMFMQEGGVTDEFIVQAVTGALFDFGMASMTRAFTGGQEAIRSVRAHDGKIYDQMVKKNSGQAPKLTSTGKQISKTEYQDLKIRQRAEIEHEVREVLSGFDKLVERQAVGDRDVDGLPKIEVTDEDVRGYRDPVISRDRKRKAKLRDKVGNLYTRLSDVIDKQTELQEQIDANPGGTDPVLEKQSRTLKSQRTKLQKQIDIIERKGEPEPTVRKEPEVREEPEGFRETRARKRLRELHTQRKTLIKEEKQALSDIQKATTKREENRLRKKHDQILDQIRDNKIEQEAMTFYDGEPRVVSAEDLERFKTRDIENQLMQFERGFREGKRVSKKDLKAFQSYISRTIESAKTLSKDQRGRLYKTLKKVVDQKDFEKNLEILRLQIDELAQENEKQVYLAGIDRFFKRVKKDIKAGRFDADTAAVFKEVIRYRSLKLSEHESFGDSTLERLLYDMTVLQKLDVTASDARAVYNDLVNVYEYGAVRAATMQKARDAKKELLVQTFLQEFGLDPDKMDHPFLQDNVHKRRRGRPRGQGYFEYLRTHRVWTGLVTDLMQRSKKPLGTTLVEQMTDTFSAERHREKLQHQIHREKMSLFSKIFGDKNKYDQYNRHTKELSELVKVSIQLEEGKTADIELERPVARQRWMEWQQHEGRKRLEKGGYTEKTMASIEKFLTPEDFKVMNGLRQMYNHVYQEVNAVFRTLNGYDLPYREGYTPFVPERSGEDLAAENMLDIILFNAGKSPAIDHKSPLKELKGPTRMAAVGDLELFDRYVQDMTHYVGFAKTITDIQSLFKDHRVRTAIREDSRFGQNMLDNLDQHIDRMSRGSLKKEERRLHRGALRKLARFKQSIMPFKPKRTALQLTSAVLYGSHMPIKDFAAGLRDLPGAIKSGEIKILTDTPYMQERGVHMERDLKRVHDMIMNQKNIWARKTIDNPRFNDIGMMFLKVGDRGGILLGAWPLYKYYSKSMPKPEALYRALEVTNKTQQSSDITQMSNIMATDNFIASAAGVFKHTTQQYFNDYLDHLVSRARMGKGELAKTLAAYHVQAVLYQLVQNGFNLSKVGAVGLLARSLAGPLTNAVLYFGETTEAVIQYALATAMDDSYHYTTYEGPLQMYKDTTKVLQLTKQALDEGLDMESVIELMRSTTKISAPWSGALGAATEATLDVAEGVRTAYEDGDFFRMLLKFAGYTDYQARRD